MINIKNFIQKAINTYDPSIDTKEGTVLYDFLIGPISSILEPFYTEQTNFINNFSLSKPEDVPESIIDAIAMNYLITRSSGSKASGEIYLYLTEAKTVNISKGTIFETNGLQFETSVNYIFNKLQVEMSYQSPYYVIGPITVFAIKEGNEYNITSNSSFKSNSLLSFTPAKITNINSFSAGINKETNVALINRIKRNLYGKSLASPLAIKNFIFDNDPNIEDVEVIGAGSNYMYRDLIYDKEEVSNKSIANFLYTYSGIHYGVYDSKHIAYTGNFVDTDATSSVAFPAVNAWSSEFTNSMYQNIYELQDLNCAEQSYKVLIENEFNATNSFNSLLTSGIWNIHDSLGTENKIQSPSEFDISNGELRLGKTINTTNTSDAVLNLNYYEFIEYNNLLKAYNSAAAQDRNNIGDEKRTLRELQAWMEKHQHTSLNNYSPIIHRALDQHTGIQIECSMLTTDNTEFNQTLNMQDGEICYITVLRNNKLFMAHDGFGIAWRKQPEFLIRIAKNTYTDIALKELDIQRFNEEFNTNTGLQWLGHLSDAAYIVGGKSAKYYWKSNVYLVDNDILQEESWIGYDQIWEQASGRNQFLQAGKAWIEPNVYYDFKIKIYETLAVETWVYPTSFANSFLYDEIFKCINFGSRDPQLVPISGNKNLGENGISELDSTRGQFGIAVGQTRNCEWYVKNLNVFSFIETFPMHLFKFKIDADSFSINDTIWINYYGMGIDSTLTSGISKIQVGLYDPRNNAGWQILGTKEKNYNIDEILNVSGLLFEYPITEWTNYIDEYGYINIAAAATNISDYNHYLKTYFVELNTGPIAGAHRGNATDIYCHDPLNINIGSAIVTLTTNYITTGNLINIHPFIQEILEVRGAISKLAYDTTSYTIFNLDPGNSFGPNANYKIVFADENIAGAQIEIVYRYWNNGTRINNLISSSEYRYPSADYMAKIMPPTRIIIYKLEYSNGLAADAMKLKICEYFNKLQWQSFDKSDLINELYNQGATYVDLDIDIQIYQYDSVYNKSTIDLSIAQSYEIPANVISRFYCHIQDLSGVRQI